jgi:DNA-binding MarR family transcriptional regulator
MAAEGQARTNGLNALAGIDRAIHEPARLLVMAHLSVLDSADFLFLLKQTGLTRGNLSSHVRRLEEVGYVQVEKTFVDRMPLTVYRLTDAGRQALTRYRDQMAGVLTAMEAPPGS